MEIENNWHCALEQSRVAQFFRFSKKRFFFYSARIASMRNFSRRVLFSFDFSSFFLFFLTLLYSRYYVALKFSTSFHFLFLPSLSLVDHYNKRLPFKYF